MSSDRPGRQTTVLETDVGLARGADLAKLQRRVRTLVRELMREVLAAVAMASPAEIGELYRERPERKSFGLEHAPAVAPLVSAVRSSSNGLRAPSARSETAPPRTRLRARRGLVGRTPPAQTPRKEGAAVVMQQDPFAITSPGELLASGGSERDRHERREREAETAEHRPPREPVALHAETPAPPEPVLPSLLEAPAPSPSSDKVVESERRPRIVLREGERLLSATGSGVVIRRERRVVPNR